MLYKIPRTLLTTGVRMFGRLAFFDHYRSLMGKIHAAIDNAVAADSMTQTEEWTGLSRRTNRPVVYVVAGLGGGTGSGMFIDIAYAVQNRLRRMGYSAPEVIGILVTPPADPAVSQSQTLGNTYAALTELNHYSRPNTTYTANHDERFGLIQEKSPPFAALLRHSGSGRTATRGRSGWGGGLEWFASVFDSAHDPGGRFACDRQARFARDGEAGFARHARAGVAAGSRAGRCAATGTQMLHRCR